MALPASRELPSVAWPHPVPVSSTELFVPVPGHLVHVQEAGGISRIDDRGGQLSGHVLTVETAPGEPPDFSLTRMLARLCWLGVTALVPLAIAHGVFVHVGGLSALAVLVLAWFALRWLTPSSLLALMQLHYLINPAARRHQDLVPVRFFRVRDAAGAEALARMKGRFTRGNLMAGDIVTFHGSWRNGALHAHRAWSHRTHSTVLLDQSGGGMALLVALLVLMVLAAYFLHAFSSQDVAVLSRPQDLP